MVKFKAGQEVICINDIDSALITVGSIYTIDSIDDDDTLELRGVGWWYDPERFILLTPAAALLYKNLPTGQQIVDTSEHF